MKSDYCTQNAAKAMTDLIDKLKCRYIVLSYNNNGTRLNGRSNARISDDELFDILCRRGTVSVFEASHRPFSAGKGKNDDNKERLFVCHVQR